MPAQTATGNAMQERSVMATRPNVPAPTTRTHSHNRLSQVIERLYREAEVAPPSPAYPIAPLSPLVDSLPIVCCEIADLTARRAEAYLLRGGSVRNSFVAAEEADAPLSGFLYAMVGTGGVHSFLFLRQNDVLVRRRFSLAHELGHLHLHIPQELGKTEQTVFYDLFTEAEAAEGNENRPDLYQREWEADQFAAELLMPESVVRPLTETALQEGFVETGLTERLAMALLVSRAAMYRRLCALNLLPGTPLLLAEDEE